MTDHSPAAADNKERFLGVPDRYSNSLTPMSTNQSVTQTRSRSQSRPGASLRSTRSYVDAHGTYFTEREPPAADDSQDVKKPLEKTFEVDWDGPDDPMNPRNMSSLRKWLVVITLAFGSLCVTCTSSLYTVTYGKSSTANRSSVLTPIQKKWMQSLETPGSSLRSDCPCLCLVSASLL